MIKKRVKINFVRIPTEMIIELARYIISKMTGNMYFLIPDPPLAELIALVDDLEVKNTLALEGRRQARAEKKDARVLLNEILHRLGLYVSKIANGNETIMISSGFPVSKDP